MTAEASLDAVDDANAVQEGVPRCGARTRTGGRCRLGAGAGTDHPGYGNCKYHAGSTPGGRKSAAKQRLAVIVPSPIGGFDAIERALGLMNGLVDALERELTKVEDGVVDGVDLHATVRLARDAARDLATVGKLAADAGLDERRIRLEEAKLSLLAATLRAVFADPELNLDATRQEIAAKVAARHLRELPT